MSNGSSGSGRGGNAGGRSSSSNQQSVANQAPNSNNVPVLPGGVTALTQMTDDELEALILSSKNIDMPNHLADVADTTQSFVYAAGLNEKPTVLDTAAFNQFMADNNISSGEIMSRSTGGANYNVNGMNIRMSPQQVSLLIKNGNLNYIGGKHGGQAYGAGTYFDMNGGGNTGYANGTTLLAVLNPATAHVVTDSSLRSMVGSWQATHPKATRALGKYSTGTMSVYASMMGFNVITDGYGYHNVIDRSAIVVRKDDI